jgi:hypothetical protein
MGNPTTVHKQKAFSSPIDKELFNKNRRSARDHYGKFFEKLLTVTGGRVIYDYEEFNKRE